MAVLNVRLAAEITHRCPAVASHPVAPVQLDKGFLAVPACPHQRLRHLVLDVRTLSDLGILLHLFTSLGDVADFSAQPATLLSTVRILTVENLGVEKTTEYNTSTVVFLKLKKG